MFCASTGKSVQRYSDLQVLVAERAGIARGHRVLDAGTGPRALPALPPCKDEAGRGISCLVAEAREVRRRMAANPIDSRDEDK